MKNEIALAPSAESSMQEIPIYLSIALQYGRPKQVAYVRDTLQPLIWAVIDGVVNEEKLDLETDPCIVSHLFLILLNAVTYLHLDLSNPN